MPTITIDPTTITNPEEWLKAWQYAVFVLRLTAAKVTPVPTTPEQYQDLLTMINEELARKSGGLLYYGSQMFPAVTANGGTALVAVQATDPSLVNTLSASPIDEIVTTGTSIGTVVATTATGSYSYVKRGVALATALSLLGATLFAAQLTPEDKEDLEFSVDPLTDENDNVLCYTDEEGTTYLPEDFIERLRQKLIELGVYNTSDQIESAPTGFNTSDISFPLSVGHTVVDTGLENRGYRIYALTDVKFVHSNGRVRYPYIGVPVNTTPNINSYTEILNTSNNGMSTTVSMGTSGTYSDGTVELSDGVYTFAQLSNPAEAHTYTFDSKTAYAKSVFNPYIEGWTYAGVLTPSQVSTTSIDSISRMAWLLRYGDVSGGGGVPGIETDPTAILPSNAGTLMSEYFDDWYDRKKIFKGITQDDEGDITGVTDITFLPAGLSDTQGLDEDTTQTQAEAQSGDPVIDPSKLDDLLPAIKEFFDNFIPTDPDIPTPTIPVEDSGDSPTPTPPLITGAGSDLIAIYNPTKTQIQEFNQFLWSLDPTQLVNWKKIFINPIDAVIALQMIYVTPITGETRHIKCGYIETDVSSKIVTNQYKDVDCGTVNLIEFYSNVWDYVDTQVSIYLPFVGIVPLDTREIMGSILHVKYRVDVYTGTCLAQIIVTKANSTAVLYTFPGNCAVQLPITSGQFSALWGAMIGAIGIGIGGMVAGIPGAGAMADSYAASKLMNSGGVSMQRSGNIGSNAGAMGSRVPYLIITHPVPYDAGYYNKQYGYPLNQTTRIGDVTGYTRIKDVHLSGIPCTDDELEQIERLLKDGVIVN